MVRKYMQFYGRVQGVGFRYNAYYLAQSRRVTGWVRNEYDGSVTMEVQGETADISEFVRTLCESRYVSVEDIRQKAIPVDEYERSFEIKHN